MISNLTRIIVTLFALFSLQQSRVWNNEPMDQISLITEQIQNACHRIFHTLHTTTTHVWSCLAPAPVINAPPPVSSSHERSSGNGMFIWNAVFLTLVICEFIWLGCAVYRSVRAGNLDSTHGSKKSTLSVVHNVSKFYETFKQRDTDSYTQNRKDTKIAQRVTLTNPSPSVSPRPMSSRSRSPSVSSLISMYKQEMELEHKAVELIDACIDEFKTKREQYLQHLCKEAKSRPMTMTPNKLKSNTNTLGNDATNNNNRHFQKHNQKKDLLKDEMKALCMDLPFC